MIKLIVSIVLSLFLTLSIHPYDVKIWTKEAPLDPFSKIKARELSTQEMKNIKGGETIFRVNAERTKISVFYVNERNGREFKQGEFAISNVVPNKETPYAMTMPGRDGEPQLYFPETFPSGIFEITGIARGKDPVLFGGVSIITNAKQQVTTYTRVGNKLKENKNPQWDYGYLIHAGGGNYLSPTHGCIRTTDSGLAGMVRCVETEYALSQNLGRQPKVRIVVPSPIRFFKAKK